MARIKVFIVDDEFKARDTLAQALTTFFDHVEVCGMASNPSEAYQQIELSKPDLVLMDIEMGQESGFQLLEKFDEVYFHVTFVTAHEEFALKAIKFSALDYIIKPASVSELKALLQKVEKNPVGKQGNPQIKHMFTNFLLGDKKEHKITLSTGDGYEFVKVGDTLYLRADGSYTTFYLSEGKQLTASKNLKFFEGILEGYGFYRIHNSTLINLRFIKRFNRAAGGYVVMEDDAEFSISKGRKDEFMQLFSLG